MSYAVIDIGSNSVRLLISSNKPINEKTLITTRLALNARDGFLSTDKIIETANAVVSLYNTASRSNVKQTFIFATEAVRSALNASELTLRIKDACGLDVQVLSGNEEAQIGFLGACGKTEIKTCLLDIGGASTEIAEGKNGTLTLLKSVPIGIIRLMNEFANFIDANDYIENAYKDISKTTAKKVVAIGGTATSIAGMALELKTYSAIKVHNATVSLSTLQTLYDQVKRLKTTTEIKNRFPSLQSNRAEVIGYGLLAFIKLLQAIGKTSFTVSERDNLEGYLQYKNLL